MVSLKNATRLIPGLFVLLSLLLGVKESPVYLDGLWLLMNGFVGLMLLQSGITQVCPLEMMLKRAGLE